MFYAINKLSNPCHQRFIVRILRLWTQTFFHTVRVSRYFILDDILQYIFFFSFFAASSFGLSGVRHHHHFFARKYIECQHQEDNQHRRPIHPPARPQRLTRHCPGLGEERVRKGEESRIAEAARIKELTPIEFPGYAIAGESVKILHHLNAAGTLQIHSTASLRFVGFNGVVYPAIQPPAT